MKPDTGRRLEQRPVLSRVKRRTCSRDRQDGSEGRRPVGEGIEELESRNEVMPPKSTDPASAVRASTRPRPTLRTTSPDATPAARLAPLGPAHVPPASFRRHAPPRASCPAHVGSLPRRSPDAHPSSSARRLAPGEIDREEREDSNDDRSTGEIAKELERKRGK
jgi:hypothetical protein